MIELRPQLNAKNLLSRVTSLEIFERYCENLRAPGEKFRDRSDDKDPSCIVDMWKGDYLYKDFGKPGSFRAIPYVAHKFNESFYEALKRINRDFRLGLGTDEEVGNPSETPLKSILKPNENLIMNRVKSSQIVEIKIKRRQVEKRDIDYWGAFGWTEELLRAARIYPISHYWITNPRKGIFNYRVKVSPTQLVYSFDYYFHNSVFRRKLYFPGEEIRFISNVDHTVVQGYPLLPRSGDILVITSSMKDCGPFWRLGYPAVAPNSEHELFYEAFVQKLKSRFKRIVIWFDNDMSGIKSAKHFARRYDLEYTHTPDESEKDPSDFVYKYGLEEFSKLVQTSLDNTKKVFK